MIFERPASQPETAAPAPGQLRRMMTRLIEGARSRGLDGMYGNILAANSGMIEMVTRLGFKPMPSDGDTMTRNLLLDLRA